MSVRFKIFTMWEYYFIIIIGMIFSIVINLLIPTNDLTLSILKGLFNGFLIGVIFGGSMTSLTYRYIVKNGLFKE